MKLTIHNDAGVLELEVASDGRGRYTIRSDRVLPRQEVCEYQTEDGLHVLGLIHLVFGVADSQEYLRRRVDEHALETEEKP